MNIKVSYETKKEIGYSKENSIMVCIGTEYLIIAIVINITSKQQEKIKNGCGIVEEYDYNCFLAFKGTYKDGKRISGIEFNSHQKINIWRGLS